MAKQSPGYPSHSLPKAVAMARRIHQADRTNPIDREVAAKHIGYSGLSGASEKALASLAHYGLTEKTGKGQVRLSALAVDILFPDPSNPAADKRAIAEAAMRPSIFQDLNERFPSGHVSEAALESYLRRENFLDRAISPVTSAFLETCRFVEQMGASESHGADDSEGEQSDLNEENEVQSPMQGTTLQPAHTASNPPSAVLMAQQGESEWMRNLVGRDTQVRLLVTGEIGPKEIGRLIKLLEAQKAVLDDEEPE